MNKAGVNADITDIVENVIRWSFNIFFFKFLLYLMYPVHCGHVLCSVFQYLASMRMVLLLKIVSIARILTIHDSMYVYLAGSDRHFIGIC